MTIKRLPDDAVPPYEKLFYDACREAAKSNDLVLPGEMREVTEINPVNGHKEITFYGPLSFIHDMKPPVRRVRSFRTDQGYVNTSGGPLR